MEWVKMIIVTPVINSSLNGLSLVKADVWFAWQNLREVDHQD